MEANTKRERIFKLRFLSKETGEFSFTTLDPQGEFTGFFDKDNQEIYEGDVLQFEQQSEYSYTSDKEVWIESVHMNTYYGGWYCGTFRLWNALFTSSAISNRAKVIGNVLDGKSYEYGRKIISAAE